MWIAPIHRCRPVGSAAVTPPEASTDRRDSASMGRLRSACEPAFRLVERVSPIVVVVALVAATVARFLTRSDLWLDEALTTNISRLPIGEIGPWLRHDGAPPLFYWMLHGWMTLFGTSDVAVRSLAGVFGVAALPLAFVVGKRVGGSTTAWIALIVLACNPYAVRFATETRMYGVEIFLSFLGILAVRRAFERPQHWRLLLVALVAAALVLTHYWALSLVAVSAGYALLVAWRSVDLRPAALRVFVAIGVGAASFLVWVPNFLYQAKHTGTPWAVAQLPPIPIARSILEFVGGDRTEGWALVYVAVALLIVGVAGHATERGTIEIDIRTHSSVAPEAFVGFFGLAIGATVAYAGGSGFQARYVALILPFFVIVVARGISLLGNARVRSGTVAFVMLAGAAGVARNITDSRTQGGDAARVILRAATAGDVVVYCPDQLGPSVHRVLERSPSKQLVEMAYPNRRDVALVDWVDYTSRLDAVSAVDSARTVLAFVPSGANIFVVTSAGYITHAQRCDEFVDALAVQSKRQRKLLLASDPEVLEHANVIQLPASPLASE